MMNALAQAAAWLSAAASFLGRFLLALVGVVPGWLSATVIAAVTGVLLARRLQVHLESARDQARP